MTICAALSTGLSAQSIYPGQHAGKMKKVTTAPIQVESFDLKDVRLLPSRFRDNMTRDSVWMTSIATDRLLHSFRNNAGVAYFLPLLSGSHKVYSTRENSFWCCVGSGFENHAKYGEAIYYHNDQGIYVNLFIPSEVNWKAKGITLRQETAFPAEENTALTIQTNKPVTTTIYLRYPSWSKGVKVNVNGEKVSVKQKPGSYIAVTRQWKDGNRIEANYPMSLQLETTPDNPQKGALLYGPLVLAGEAGTEGMQSPAPFSDPALYNDYYTYNYHIPAELNTTLQIDRKHPGHSLQRTGEELIFKTSQGNVLKPLYDLHHQRYVVYWDLSFTSCRPADNRQAAYDFTPLDSIVTSWMNKGYYPGASICVVRDDSVIFQKNYKNFTPDTKVYVASAGKWVAAAVIGAVVDCTELDWNDSVKKWIPEFKNDIKGMITLRQLLSHTSGVRPYLPEPRVDNYNHLDSAVMEILPLDTVFTPGTRFEYGGLAMQIAGRMAEKAMNKEFEELFQELIARPLRMKNSHFTPVNTDGGHAPMLGGGLCTTLHDYMRFLDMIYHNGAFKEKQILKPETIHEMQADQVGNAEVHPGEYVERALKKHHTGIYGLGEWRELIDKATGEAYQISSPGWAGAYPWINKQDRVYGFFIAHVQGSSQKEDGFSSFFGSPVISQTVSNIISPKR